MIQVEAKKFDGGRLIVIGLSNQDIQTLKKGMQLANDLNSVEVFLFHGETDRDCFNEVREFIGPETKIINGKNLIDG